jgi:hypothetical protein
MKGFDGEVQGRERPHALSVWSVSAVVLLGPSLLVWLVRLAAVALQCAPGPGLCHGVALGGGFRDTLGLAWLVAWDTRLSLAIAFVAAIAAIRLCRPLMASLSLLILPLAALILPAVAVLTSTYPGCEPNEDGIGDCVLWGAHVGLDFHRAAMAAGPLYAIAPYSISLGLMLGAIGLLFFRHQSNSAHRQTMDPFDVHRVTLRSRDPGV